MKRRLHRKKIEKSFAEHGILCKGDQNYARQDEKMNWFFDLGVGRVQGGGDGYLVLSARRDVESALSHYRHVQVVNNCNLQQRKLKLQSESESRISFVKVKVPRTTWKASCLIICMLRWWTIVPCESKSEILMMNWK